MHRLQLSVVTAALLLIAATLPTSAQVPSATCDNPSDIAVLTSPLVPWKGAPLRVVVATETAGTGELSLLAPGGAVAVTSREQRGGPPYFWTAEVAAPVPGKWQVKLSREGATAGCTTISHDVTVRRSPGTPPRTNTKSTWPVRATWTRGTENLYSAWIETLFDAPLEVSLSWPALHDVLRDKSRNILFNHLGLREDEKGLVIRPDCADLPYVLRAYFAFKMGLPYGYAKCTRGAGGKAPKCPQWWNIDKEEPTTPVPEPEQQVAAGDFFGLFGNVPASTKASANRLPPKPPGLVPGFGYYVHTVVANGVHSGNGRAAADDDNTDYYSVSLTQETLRPGTIYADPYGHLLVLTKRIRQSDGNAGVLLAVDGQPDGTIARKRFWRGNFLFAQDTALGSPGFKRFRPVVAGKNGGLRRLTNAEISKAADYGDFSLDQSMLKVEDFYDVMDDVLSPAPLDPMRAMKEAITALEEQVKTRVTSVENGRKYLSGGGAEVAIPEGASIFETTGAWEDFATPSRDLRLLIAIDVVRGFPDRVARRPERYAMPKDKSVADVKRELESVLTSDLAQRKFMYTRTDGSQWTLALKEVIDRSADLEMAYNVNDCVEQRWGAPSGGEEKATCKRSAPDAQREKMTDYRAWFRERRRPPRG